MNFKNTVFFSGVAVLLSFLILNGSSVTYSSSFAQQQNMNTKQNGASKGVAIGQFSQTGGITADY